MMTRRELLGSAGALSLVPVLPTMATGMRAPYAAAFEARLNIGPARSGVGNHRWALIVGGGVVGDLLHGTVRSGRLDWHTDPASGAAQVELHCWIRCTDVQYLELRDRSAWADQSVASQLPGLPTAPRLLSAAGTDPVTSPLVGRLDPTGLPRGMVLLRAFHLA
jgi:hypothetical protein